MSDFIYTDYCSQTDQDKIKQKLNLDIVLRDPDEKWSVNEALGIITTPSLVLAVINIVDEISIMEIALLNFMCKRILVTSKSIVEYPTVCSCINYTDFGSNLKKKDNHFVEWYSKVMEQ